MHKNVCSTDRLIRAIIGIALILWGTALDGPYLAWMIGLVPLATAVFSYCPFYEAIGKGTLKTTPPPS